MFVFVGLCYNKNIPKDEHHMRKGTLFIIVLSTGICILGQSFHKKLVVENAVLAPNQE